MAKVTTMSGIASISGRLGNYCFRTMKKSGNVYVHEFPRKQSKKKPRPSKTIGEVENQERFAKRAQVVSQMYKAGSKIGRKGLWKLATQAV